MRADCLFCRIATGTLPAHLVHEDEEILGFLDINPIRPGHALVIPRRHFAYFEELPAALAARITAIGQDLARAMKSLYSVPRVAFCYTGTDIAHVHAHVVPLVAPTDITSRRYIAEETLTFRPTPRAPDAELAATAQTLRAALARGC